MSSLPILAACVARKCHREVGGERQHPVRTVRITLKDPTPQNKMGCAVRNVLTTMIQGLRDVNRFFTG